MKLEITLILLIFSILSPVKSQNIELMAADSLFRNGQPEKAKTAFEALLRKDPACWQCCYGLACIAFDADQKKEAVEWFGKALAGKEWVYTYINRAQAYYDLEDMEHFCADNKRAIEILTENEKDLSKAETDKMKDMKRLAEDVCNVEQPSFFLHRSIAAANLNDTASAGNWLEKGLQKHPGSALIHNYLGNHWLMLNQFSKAEPHYVAALVKQEDILQYVESQPIIPEENKKTFLAQSFSNLALTQLYQQKLDSALVSAEQAIKWLPKGLKSAEIGDFHNIHGEILLQKNQYKEALAAFQRALDQNQNLVSAYANYALCNALSAEEDQAKRRVRFSFAYANKQAYTEFQTGNVGPKQQSAYALSLVLMNKAINLAPENPDFYHFRADLKRLLGQSDFCLDYQSAAIRGKQEAARAVEQFCKK